MSWMQIWKCRWPIALTGLLLAACAQAQMNANTYATRFDLAAVESPRPRDEAVLQEAGREGRFIFQAADLSARVATDRQQGVYIAPARSPSGARGAWVRVYDGALNIEWFGATGDDETDDTAAIEGALSMKGEIFVPPGTFHHAPSAETGFLSDTTIFGAGSRSVIRYAPHGPPIFTDIQQVLRPRAYANVENIVIRDLVIDGNRDGVDWRRMQGDGGAFGIGLWGTQNVQLDNIEVRNAYTDAYLFAFSHGSNPDRRNTRNVRFGRLSAYNSGRQGMSIVSAENVVGNHLHVDTVNRTGPGAALDLEPDVASPDLVKGIRIDRVTARNVRAGILLAGVSPIEDVSFGTVILEDVNQTLGIYIKKARNVRIDHAEVRMGNALYYGFWATDFENVRVGSLKISQVDRRLEGTNGGALIDVLPADHHFDNRGLRIDRFEIDGARGTGFRHSAGTLSIGFAKAANVNQVRNGSPAFHLEATADIERIESLDGTPAHPIVLGSSNNRIRSGQIAEGAQGGIQSGGHRADLGTLRIVRRGRQSAEE